MAYFYWDTLKAENALLLLALERPYKLLFECLTEMNNHFEVQMYILFVFVSEGGS